VTDFSEQHSSGDNRLIIVSNRLPCVIRRGTDGQWHSTPGSGGLVSALRPVLRKQGGVWIGWSGTVDEPVQAVDHAVDEAMQHEHFELRAVPLSAQERDDFYKGFSNEVLWPLFHDQQAYCNFKPRYWDAYERVNSRFARATLEQATPRDFVWVQDYHLIPVGEALRQAGFGGPLGFFLHIPFPNPDVFFTLPWRQELLDALLAYDLVGFQTPRDRHNFLECVRALGRKAQATHTGVFPIGIDFDRYDGTARSAETEAQLARLRDTFHGQKLILGVDRLDYSKGLLQKLEAFREALERYPRLRGRVTLVQQVVPSRDNIPSYARLRSEFERRVGEINGQFSHPHWVPIIYRYQHLSAAELSAHFRAADVLLVTALKDGMNLVCKEYVASRWDERGVLVLSEFAGAAGQLSEGARIINPYDQLGVAEAIRDAVEMAPEQQGTRMRRLRSIVQCTDVFGWAQAFLEAVTSARPRRLATRRPSSGVRMVDPSAADAPEPAAELSAGNQ
jgi:trehalose 6-phosphate synthase